MKILLIKPSWFHKGDAYRYKEFNHVAPLGLGIIAALSEGHEVKIIDEDIEKIDYSKDWDLVGITVVTFISKRAYSISENFRKLGVKTVLGGYHPSLVPEESLQYADSIVIGEAENVWQRLLHDLEKDKLKKTYNGSCFEDLDKLPFPRRDLFSKKYFAEPVQITRGCVNSCKYCCLQTVPWGKWRKRNNLDRVYKEMSIISSDTVFIIDENLFVDVDYVKRFCDKIVPLKKYWGIQAPGTIAQDDRLLEKMAEAGCVDVVINFNTVNDIVIKKYESIVNRVNSYGIMVQAFFMFGFDSDGKEVFKDTVEAIKKLDIDDAILFILTPYPGTEYFELLKKEERILTKDWSKYSYCNCVFQPDKMSPEELDEGLRWAYQELNNHYNWKSLPERVWKYRKRLFENIPISLRLMKGYVSGQVNVKRLP